jgi:hypothetical protein
VTIGERTGEGRRERRVLALVSRAAWRLEQAERERTWALVPARAEGISICALVTAIGLSPSRVDQIVADADPDALDAGARRAAGSGLGTEPFFSAENVWLSHGQAPLVVRHFDF